MVNIWKLAMDIIILDNENVVTMPNVNYMSDAISFPMIILHDN
jgi:hypothetical protein